MRGLDPGSAITGRLLQRWLLPRTEDLVEGFTGMKIQAPILEISVGVAIVQIVGIGRWKKVKENCVLFAEDMPPAER